LTLGFGRGISTLGGSAINNTTAFKYYRLLITKNRGSDIGVPTNITQLAEVGFFVNGRTGDGGGLFDTAHLSLVNSTFSRNIAGCTNSSCACSDAWCASVSNASAAFGRGGGFFSGNAPVPETFSTFLTIAANSASQGGGVFREVFDDCNWQFSIIGHNAARTTSAPEPDFHGNPHSLQREGGNLFGNAAGVTISTDGGRTGLVLPGQFGCNGPPNCDPDRVADPKLNTLQFNGGPLPSMLTHFLQGISPALDLVPFGSVPTGPTDERGFPRTRGPGPTPSADYGAVEIP